MRVYKHANWSGQSYSASSSESTETFEFQWHVHFPHARMYYAKGFALIGFELFRIIMSIIIRDYLQNNTSNPKKPKQTLVSNRKLNCSKEARKFS